MKYDIWIEGYSAAGEYCNALRVAAGVEGDSFEDACKKYFAVDGRQARWGVYNEKDNSVWGCRLFDNYDDAARSFG